MLRAPHPRFRFGCGFVWFRRFVSRALSRLSLARALHRGIHRPRARLKLEHLQRVRFASSQSGHLPSSNDTPGGCHASLGTEYSTDTCEPAAWRVHATQPTVDDSHAGSWNECQSTARPGWIILRVPFLSFGCGCERPRFAGSRGRALPPVLLPLPSGSSRFGRCNVEESLTRPSPPFPGHMGPATPQTERHVPLEAGRPHKRSTGEAGRGWPPTPFLAIDAAAAKRHVLRGRDGVPPSLERGGSVDWRDICLRFLPVLSTGAELAGARAEMTRSRHGPAACSVSGRLSRADWVDEATWPLDLTRLASGRDGAIASCQMARQMQCHSLPGSSDIAGVS